MALRIVRVKRVHHTVVEIIDTLALPKGESKRKYYNRRILFPLAQCGCVIARCIFVHTMLGTARHTHEISDNTRLFFCSTFANILIRSSATDRMYLHQTLIEVRSPLRCPRSPLNQRQLGFEAVARFPLLIYSVEPDRVCVLAIVHQRQGPGFGVSGRPAHNAPNPKPR